MKAFFTKQDSNLSLRPTNQPPRQVPWVEKYRPESLNDISSQDHAVSVLKRTLLSSNLPHMLFYGPPGTGKTSTILALARELYGPDLMKSRVLELNASDERGIAIVREKVKNFARTAVSTPSAATKKQYPCPPYKLIILDEADSMTQDAQSALRRTMETYSRITRFCLICNYVTRIIDPLASRCSKFRFKPLDSTDAATRLQDICEKESLSCQIEVIPSILNAADGDLRKAITLLQSAAKLHGSLKTDSQDNEGDTKMDSDQTEITVSSIEEISGRVPADVITKIFESASTEPTDSGHGIQQIEETVEDVILDGWSATQILLQLHDTFVLSDEYSPAQKNKMVAAFSETDKRLLDGADEHISILDLVVTMATVLRP
ncbi:P-loop containing nucleoside triphosphate hydrolase protein [Lipomyces oligophaga]|uniref:P-loop containing nucleoside triphosphate hydrolase protein n=1 Tax=Lipomyces oligophaga TaxID=45792 RepID=UPI0034CD637B